MTELICEECGDFKDCKLTLLGRFICEECGELPFIPLDKTKVIE